MQGKGEECRRERVGREGRRRERNVAEKKRIGERKGLGKKGMDGNGRTWKKRK